MIRFHLDQPIDGVLVNLPVDDRVVLRAKQNQVLVAIDLSAGNRLGVTRSIITLANNVSHFSE
ncbi:hypothetical protein [Roseimaritima ulvae]|nr:hypothetical protein [Roseimaritima ulvae]